MTYLLDTNACIAAINGRPPGLRRRLRDALGRGDAIALSTVTEFELRYGVAKSARAGENAERLAIFLGPMTILAFDGEDARTAGEVRADLERRGTPIGAYDLIIAGTALSRGLVLVTADMREFRRVKGLRIENCEN